MERVLEENERIKRAEELYYKRNNMLPVKSMTNKNKQNLIKNKLLFDLVILINIVVIVFAIKNKDFVFSKEFLNVINDYNSIIYNEIAKTFKDILNEDTEYEEQENIIINNVTNEDLNIQNSAVLKNQEDEKMVENSTENLFETNTSSINEMENDIENLKNIYSFQKPVQGTISSVFGSRESEKINVSGYHTGIDIANIKGTPIYSAFDGIVTLVSDVGNYGKHLKIRCNNVTTVYAHCSKILVEEGQIVSKGQEIAKVGSTGNSTGPHLHFEIRIDDRYVDPGRIISF